MWCPVLGTSWRGRHGVRPCLENDRREAKKGTGSRRGNRRSAVTTHLWPLAHVLSLPKVRKGEQSSHRALKGHNIFSIGVVR